MLDWLSGMVDFWGIWAMILLWLCFESPLNGSVSMRLGWASRATSTLIWGEMSNNFLNTAFGWYKGSMDYVLTGLLNFESRNLWREGGISPASLGLCWHTCSSVVVVLGYLLRS